MKRNVLETKSSKGRSPKASKFSPEVQAYVDHLDRMKDSEIDYSEIPEDDIFGIAKRVGKKQVSVRIDTDVLDWLKSYGSGYQSRMNTILKKAMEMQKVASAKPSKR